MITFVTVTLPEISPEWIAERRELIAREGRAVRGATTLAGGFTIEVKSLRTNTWHPLGWHHGAICFATQGERDQVLKQLYTYVYVRDTEPTGLTAPMRKGCVPA